MKKIYINGESIGSLVFKNKVEYDEITKLDKVIGHLKRNKKRYMMAVTAIALLVDLSGVTLLNTTVASASIDTLNGLQSQLQTQVNDIIKILNFVARYACMGMGLKEMIITLLNGGNLKEATYAGLQYWLGYLFLKFYPTLYN